MSKQALELFAKAQQSVGVSYKQGKIDIEDSIVMQSIDVLEGYVKGEVKISASDISILEHMSKHLLHILRGPLYKKVFALHQELSKNILQLKENNAKLENFDKVISVLNNKKQARKLSMENLVQAKEIIEADTEHSYKQKQRAKQQLQSYALIKYGETKQNYGADFEPYQKFISTFRLSYQKTTNKTTSNKPEVKEKIETSPKEQNLLWAKFQKGKNAITAKLNQAKNKVKKLYDRYEPMIAFGALMTVAVVGWKAFKSVSNDKNLNPYRATKTVVQNPSMPQKTEKTADFSKVQAEMKIKPEIVKEQTKVASNYYDTSLQIHLGSKEAVQNLYNKIDDLAKSGKIKFIDGMDTKRYAHSFTMYNLIRPNSAENKAIQNLLSGGNENPDLINRLVLKAKAKGEGIKADNNSNKTSNFDKADKQLQLQHLKNLQMYR